MYLFIENQTNIVSGVANSVDYLDNGYPRDTKNNIAYPTQIYHIVEVENVPKKVELYKYCYTEEKGFYINEDYVEPKMYSQEQYDAVIAELVTEDRL